MSAEKEGAEQRSTASSAVDDLREGPGTRIGPYLLMQQLGEGGFGVVFLAEQEEPVRRRVALKIIKLGMDTRQVVARFEQERQALAIMEHPNIARVIDAGATATGRPYFVMELVQGEPITEYCDEHKLTIESRLELFAQVCTAVQHAHTKGIIHRDLKPSNVLIATQDGRPNAKIIDFGIAKATAAKLTDKTLLTEQRQVVGTLQYMSPEQAEGSADIDTRTDVYSLGVLLYELLTATTPFEAHTVRDAMFLEIQRMICHVDPPKPSTRLHQSGETLAGIAARRNVQPKELSSQVRGELDWIVMKALAKERHRRYTSADDLAADIGRYLAGEAITAAPPSAGYRLRKLVLRHKVPVAAGLFVVLAIVVGATLAIVGFVQASRQRDLAVAASARAVDEAARASEAEVRAVDEARRATSAEANAVAEAQSAQQISEFLARMLRGVGPGVALGRDTTLLREIVDKTAHEVDSELGDEPKVASRLLRIISTVYFQLALHDQAEASALRAIELLRNDPDADPLDMARALHNLALVFEAKGMYPMARAKFQEAYDLYRAQGADHTEDGLSALSGVAGVYVRTKEFSAAEPLLREVLEGQRALANGRDTASLASVLDRLGVVMSKRHGDVQESEQMARESLAMRRRLYGDVHPDIALSLSNLASKLSQQGRVDEALEFAEQSCEQHRQIFGDEHPWTAAAQSAHATILENAGRLEDAVRMRRLALSTWLEKLGPDHRSTLDGRFNLGQTLEAFGDHAGAEAEYRAMLAWARANYPAGDLRTAGVTALVANAIVAQGRYADAEPLLSEALDAQRAGRARGHAQVVDSQNALAKCRVAQRKFADAEPLLLEIAADVSDAGEGSAAHVQSMTRLVELYTAWDSAEPGRGHDERKHEWQEKLDRLR